MSEYERGQSTIEKARAEGAAEERKAIVAWLRANKPDMQPASWPDRCGDRIESGEHLAPAKETM